MHLIKLNNMTQHKLVFLQTQHDDQHSTLNTFRKTSLLRQRPSFQKGQMKYTAVNKDIFSFTRKIDDDDTYLVVLHFGKNTTQCNFSDVGSSGKVVLASGNVKGSLREESVVDLTSIVLKPGDGIVCQVLGH